MGQTASSVRRDASRAENDNQSTDEIRREIEQTRAEMSDTLDAIQRRLSPDVLKEQALDTVREATQQATDSVRAATIGRVEDMAYQTNEMIKERSGGMLDTIRQNPVPAALAAIGIGWLIFKGRSDSDEYDSRTRESYRYARGDARRYPLETRYYDDGTRRGQGSSRYGAPLYREEDEGGISHMAEQAKDTVGGAVSSAKDSVAGAVSSAKETVSGAVSSAADTVSGAAGAAKETVAGAAGSTRETVAGVASSTRDTVGDVAGSAWDRAGELGYEVRHTRRRAAGSFSQMLEDNPLALGAVALALGAAVGLAVPETEQEHRLMGEMRDDLMSKASLAASDTLQKVQRVAEETVSTAKDTAKEEVQKQGLVPDQGGSQSMGGSQGQPNAPRPQGGSPGMSSSQGQTGVVRPQSGSQGMSMGSGQGQSGSQRQGVGGQAVGGQGQSGSPTTGGQRMSGGEDKPKP